MRFDLRGRQQQRAREIGDAQHAGRQHHAARILGVRQKFIVQRPHKGGERDVVAAAGAVLVPELVLAGTDLLTPPCPLQAPRPPLEEEPSLQVTVVVAVSWAEETALTASSVAPTTAPHATTL